MHIRHAAVLALAGIAAACTTVPQAAAPACDRACLAESLQAYLAAVTAHDPGKAPLSEIFRQTENAVVIPLGKGGWTSITALGALDRRYYDPVTGGAAFMGTVTHAGEPAIAALRLKVEGGLVTEAEWNIAHKSDPGIEGKPGDVLFDIAGLEKNPPPQRIVPPTERASRARLAGAANSYFDGITSASRDIAWANPGCSRHENGLAVTGRPLAKGLEWDGSNGASDCRSGQGRFDVAVATARRFPVIDEEAQVVISSAVFIRTHNHPKWRNEFIDVMVMDGGKLSAVYATMMYVDPERAVPNWPPYEGNFAR